MNPIFIAENWSTEALLAFRTPAYSDILKVAGAMSYYAILAVPENADADTIHNAFRVLARQYHPDAGEGSSPGKFRELVEAYETLSDPLRRRAYDRTLRPVPPRPTRVTVDDVVVEPLAQEWPRQTFAIGSLHTSSIEQLLEEMFRLFDRNFFDRWP